MTKEAFLKESLDKFDEASTDGDWCGCYEGDLYNFFPKQQAKVKSWLTEIINQAWEGGRKEGESNRPKFPRRGELVFYDQNQT